MLYSTDDTCQSSFDFCDITSVPIESPLDLSYKSLCWPITSEASCWPIIETSWSSFFDSEMVGLDNPFVSNGDIWRTWDDRKTASFLGVTGVELAESGGEETADTDFGETVDVLLLNWAGKDKVRPGWRFGFVLEEDVRFLVSNLGTSAFNFSNWTLCSLICLLPWKLPSSRDERLDITFSFVRLRLAHTEPAEECLSSAELAARVGKFFSNVFGPSRMGLNWESERTRRKKVSVTEPKIC